MNDLLIKILLYLPQLPTNNRQKEPEIKAAGRKRAIGEKETLAAVLEVICPAISKILGIVSFGY